ncbi:transposase [Kiloniella litopenaei]
MRWIKGRSSRKNQRVYQNIKKRYLGASFLGTRYFSLTSGDEVILQCY